MHTLISRMTIGSHRYPPIGTIGRYAMPIVKPCEWLGAFSISRYPDLAAVPQTTGYCWRTQDRLQNRPGKHDLDSPQSVNSRGSVAVGDGNTLLSKVQKVFPEGLRKAVLAPKGSTELAQGSDDASTSVSDAG